MTQNSQDIFFSVCC